MHGLLSYLWASKNVLNQGCQTDFTLWATYFDLKWARLVKLTFCQSKHKLNLKILERKKLLG